MSIFSFLQSGLMDPQGSPPRGALLRRLRLYLRPAREHPSPQGQARHLAAGHRPCPGQGLRALRVPGQHQGQDEPRLQTQRET